MLVSMSTCECAYLTVRLRSWSHTKMWLSRRGPLWPWRHQQCNLWEAHVLHPSYCRQALQTMAQAQQAAGAVITLVAGEDRCTFLWIINLVFAFVQNIYTGNHMLLLLLFVMQTARGRFFKVKSNDIGTISSWSSVAPKWDWSDGEWWLSMMALCDRCRQPPFHSLCFFFSHCINPASFLAWPQCPNTKTSHFGFASLSFRYDRSVHAHGLGPQICME